MDDWAVEDDDAVAVVEVAGAFTPLLVFSASSNIEHDEHNQYSHTSRSSQCTPELLVFLTDP